MVALPLEIARVYLEPAVEQHAHGREILARFTDVERIPVASHRHANPVSVFVSMEAILAGTARHAARRGPKTAPNQLEPRSWVYDVGENGYRTGWKGSRLQRFEEMSAARVPCCQVRHAF